MDEPRIEIVTPGRLVVIHNITIDYNLTPLETVLGMVICSNLLIPTVFGLMEWSGRKSGVVTNGTIRLYRHGKPLSTQDARRFVINQGVIPCVPAEIAPLRKITNGLFCARVGCVVALHESNERLWRDPDDELRIAYLRCDPRAVGFDLGDTRHEWKANTWFAGLSAQA